MQLNRGAACMVLIQIFTITYVIEAIIEAYQLKEDK